jgi:hypothetical protein
MANKWLAHVKKTMKSHKGMKFGQVLKMAKKTYKGGGEGGVEAAGETGTTRALNGGLLGSAASVGGRRRSRRSRRGTRRG